MQLGITYSINKNRTGRIKLLTISLAQYFTTKPHDSKQEDAAQELLTSVMGLLNYLVETKKIEFPTCPNTGTLISGSRGGSGDGGFRLPTATTGASLSSHKEGKGIDIYDPRNKLDTLITNDPSLLVLFDLYRETPDATITWCHLTTRAPKSKARTFLI